MAGSRGGGVALTLPSCVDSGETFSYAGGGRAGDLTGARATAFGLAAAIGALNRRSSAGRHAQPGLPRTGPDHTGQRRQCARSSAMEPRRCCLAGWQLITQTAYLFAKQVLVLLAWAES